MKVDKIIRVSGKYMTMTANIDPPGPADVGELLDLSSLPEVQRVAFYGSMLAIAAADDIWGQDELDLIFQTINTDGLSQRGRNTIWEYLIDTPPLIDCLACFSTSHAEVRCAIMVYLIEVAFADRILAVAEDEALIQARRLLHISSKQIEAIDHYICNVGLIRARPRDYYQSHTLTKYKYGIWLLAALGIPAIALYFPTTRGGTSLPAMLSRFAQPGAGLAMELGAGAAILIGTAAVLTGRRLYTRYQRKHMALTRERRRRAQAAVRNLQDAVGYFTAKASLHAAVGDPSEPGRDTSPAFAARLRVLQQMLARRQPGAAAASSLSAAVPGISSR
jgi:uncharacterized tellurite resistance protein B-like protein